MRFTFFKNTLFLLVLISFSCGSQTKETNETEGDDIVIHDMVSLDDFKKSDTDKSTSESIVMGAEQFDLYKRLLLTKNVAVVSNQTSMVRENGKSLHLIDYLIEHHINVTKVFAPEHGFRGTADAGEVVKDGIDPKTKLPVISLYGDNKKPTPDQLNGIDIMIFDIQDVGARFYTYISTLHYVMEAGAENNIPLVVFDRPNPNGHYTDGPLLEPEHTSFVGMHPVPVVHGMTIGEYAKMINGQGWLSNKAQCELLVIPMQQYTHNTPYSLPVKPSPNLPNDLAINLYPSLCFFEGTIVSAGRGTEMQFQVFGAPSLPAGNFPFSFTPLPNEGAKFPKFNGELCHGRDLRNSEKLNSLNLEWLIEAYVGFGKKPNFFNPFFTKLAGTKKLQQQIEQGYSYAEIRATWLKDLETYDMMRQQYLLYK
jgi:uncharacterized protein YbbC (DUF1343 family)